jgi:hypothetical protein
MTKEYQQRLEQAYAIQREAERLFNGGETEPPLAETQANTQEPEATTKANSFLSQVRLPRNTPDQMRRSREATSTFSQQRQGEVPMQKQQPEDVQSQTDVTNQTQVAPVLPRSLGQAVANAGMTPKQEAQSQGESQGQAGRQGGQERPNHSSYYNPLPIGGVSMPKWGSETGDAEVSREQTIKRRRSRSI